MKVKKILLILIFIFFIIGGINFSFADEQNNVPSINAASAILIDNRTNKVLYSKNEDTKMFPASTTKIMTAIITLENCSLDEQATASFDAVNIPEGYATADIKIGETFTVEQLLEMLLVHSANDAANVLAEHVGGSLESFVSIMNTKANELGLTNTHFTNAYGLQDNNHYTTARDLATIMKYCLQNEDFRRICGLASCAIPATNMSEPRTYASTNQLVIAGNSNYYPYVTTGKTGFTSDAKHCLVSSAYNNDLELICVVLGSEDNFGDTRAIYNYAYSTYSIKDIVKENDTVTTISVKNASYNTKNLDLVVSEDIPALVSNSVDINSIEPQISLKENIEAPIEKGTILGRVTYSVEGVNYTTDLIAFSNVEKTRLPIYIFMGIIILVILLIVLITIIIRNKRNKNIELLDE